MSKGKTEVPGLIIAYLKENNEFNWVSKIGKKLGIHASTALKYIRIMEAQGKLKTEYSGGLLFVKLVEVD